MEASQNEREKKADDKNFRHRDRSICADESIDRDAYNAAKSVARSVSDAFRQSLATQVIKRK